MPTFEADFSIQDILNGSIQRMLDGENMHLHLQQPDVAAFPGCNIFRLESLVQRGREHNLPQAHTGRGKHAAFLGWVHLRGLFALHLQEDQYNDKTSNKDHFWRQHLDAFVSEPFTLAY